MLAFIIIIEFASIGYPHVFDVCFYLDTGVLWQFFNLLIALLWTPFEVTVSVLHCCLLAFSAV